MHLLFGALAAALATMTSPSDRPHPHGSTALLGLSASAGAYLEQIDAIIRARGFARVSDVASGLHVSRPSVTTW